MIKTNENYDAAKILLNNADGYVRKAIEYYVYKERNDVNRRINND
jgi:N-acetylmuramic acid 6-phosphate etherase